MHFSSRLSSNQTIDFLSLSIPNPGGTYYALFRLVHYHFELSVSGYQDENTSRYSIFNIFYIMYPCKERALYSSTQYMLMINIFLCLVYL